MLSGLKKGLSKKGRPLHIFVRPLQTFARDQSKHVLDVFDIT